MKKLVLIITLIALVILAVDTLADDDGYFIMCHPGGHVNVRGKPRMDASVVGWVEFGAYVKTDGKERNGFVHVVDLAAEEPEGWIYAGFLVWDKPRVEKYTAEVWGGRVIARSCVNGKQLCVLREGKRVTVLARCNRWAVTNKGYVMCDWLREVDE